jgi:hypothetical protein
MPSDSANNPPVNDNSGTSARLFNPDANTPAAAPPTVAPKANGNSAIPIAAIAALAISIPGMNINIAFIAMPNANKLPTASSIDMSASIPNAFAMSIVAGATSNAAAANGNIATPAALSATLVIKSPGINV